MFVQAVGKAPGGEGVVLNYRLIENDRLDPNKKTQNCKLYAGYILLSFRLDGEELYRFQIDYMHPQAKDLPDRIQCAVTSFLNGER